MAVGVLPRPHSMTEEERADIERAEKKTVILQRKEDSFRKKLAVEQDIKKNDEAIKQSKKELEKEANHLNRSNIERRIAENEELNRRLLRELELVTNDLNAAEHELALIQAEEASKNFDKRICLENIRFLLSQKSVKLGEIEKEAKVSPGYLSRLEKEGNTTDPSVEFLVTAAEKLGILVDTLIKTKMVRLTATEEKIIQFLTQMKGDTDSDELIWDSDSLEKLEAYEGLTVNTPQPHPLYRISINPEVGPENYYYCSEFNPERSIVPADAGLHTKLQGSSDEIYMMKVHEVKGIDSYGENYIELYHVVEDKTVHPICDTSQASKEIFDAVNALYESASIASAHIRISDKTKSMIDSYLNRK